jgi:signal peptidase II
MQLNRKAVLIGIIIFAILLIDQSVKIWVKTNMALGDNIAIFGLSWANIHFLENNGMAFGLSIGGEYGKLALSLFRIIAVGFLFYLINRLIKEQAGNGILISFAMIAAGALGNIIDSAFYGLIFSESSYHAGNVAVMFPEEGGYAGFLHGKVVDMLYFPMIDTVLPEWLPIWGGEPFQFFNPVFNIADSSICVGVVLFLIFQKNFFAKEKEEKLAASEAKETVTQTDTDSPGA